MGNTSVQFDKLYLFFHYLHLERVKSQELFYMCSPAEFWHFAEDKYKIRKRKKSENQRPPTFKADTESSLNLKQKQISQIWNSCKLCNEVCIVEQCPAHQNGWRVCFAIVSMKCSPRHRDGICALTSWGFPRKAALGLAHVFTREMHQGNALLCKRQKCKFPAIIRQAMELLMNCTH